MLLKLENVAKFYGSRLIFKEVSLELGRGETLLLAGPNGAGKSTLLKIMAGLLRPSAGRADCALKDNERLGYLGHQTFIYPALSALENLLFWNRLHALGRSEAEALALLERVELDRFAHERAGSFSRGMAQRLNLARILLLSPALLLLDEPSTGLDARSRAMLDKEIAAAARRGAGLVWISHSLDEDLGKADKVAVLADSRLDFYGGAADYATRRPPLPPAGLAAQASAGEAAS